MAWKAPVAVFDQALVSGGNFAATVLIGRFAGPHELATYALGFAVLILVGTVHESLAMAPYTVLWDRGWKERREPSTVEVSFASISCWSPSLLRDLF